MVTKSNIETDKIEYEIYKLTNEYTYSNNTLEEDFEMVSGRWNLKLFYEDKMILDKTFVLMD